MLMHMSVLSAHGSLNMATKMDRMQFLRTSQLHGDEVAYAMACASVGRTTADLWTHAKEAGVPKNKEVKHEHQRGIR